MFSQLAANGQPGTSHLRILSRPDWVAPVAVCLQNRAVAAGLCDEPAARRLTVAMTEAITNAIVHGNLELESAMKEADADGFARLMAERCGDPSFAGRVVDIRAQYSPGRCVWTVTDQGRGFDVKAILAQLEAAQATGDVAATTGRGITIMRAFVDDVSWAMGGRQVRLVIDHERVTDKRVAARQRYTAAIRVDMPGVVGGVEAIARDLSATGIGFVAAQPLVEQVAVVVTLDAGRPTARRITGRIIRCRELGGAYYDVAVHFDRDIGPLVAALREVE